MKILFANIGYRDVQISEPIPLDNESQIDQKSLQSQCRPLGKKLWERRAFCKDKLMYPILQKVVNELVNDQQNHLDRVVLFYTDQPESEDEIHRKTDSIYFADLLEAWLVEAYPNSVIKVDKVKVDRNPSDYDMMYEYYDRELGKAQPSLPDTVYACISGGTPAMNNMLMYHAMRQFEHRATILYVTPTKDKPAQLKTDKTMRKLEVSNGLEKLIKRHDYLGASEMLRLHQDLFPVVYERLQSVLAYAHHRMCFDFKNASEKLSGYEGEADYDRLREEISTSQTIARHTEELIGNARILFEQGNFIDFLGRLYRYQEAVLLEMVKGKLKLPTVYDKGSGYFFNRSEIMQINHKLSASLFPQNKKRERVKLDRTVMKKAIGCMDREDMNDFLKRLEKLDRLIHLRHQSPVAHGFDGISLEIISQNYPDATEKVLDNILEDMCYTYHMVYDQTPIIDIFAKTHNLLFALLRDA